MSEHRYILEKYSGPSTRYTCPGCKKPREFSRYVDSSTGQHVHSDVGKCNREDRCGYHYTPSQHFSETGIKPDHTDFVPTPEPKREPSFIDPSIMEQTLTGYGYNALVTFLRGRFGDIATREAVKLYRIGTSKKWKGASIFWQIDTAGMVRTGKIMQYDKNGHRVKEPHSRITWVHSELNIEGFSLFQCLFGEHLLKEYADKTVCLVESEKTAITAAILLPGYVWIATGGKNGSRWSDPASFIALKGRSVILFPDLGAFDQWSEKAEKVKHLANISVSDILEKIATDEDRENGLDIADYLLRKNKVSCMAPASVGAGSDPGPDAGISNIEIKVLVKQAERSGTQGFTEAEKALIGDHFSHINPRYKDLFEVFDLQYGEPIELTTTPF